MKISECSYCGVFALTDQGACEICWTALGMNLPSAENIVPPPEITAPINIQTVAAAFQSNQTIAPDNQTFPTNNQGFVNHHAAWQPTLDANCLRCGTPVPTGNSRCFDCDQIGGSRRSKSFPFAKLGGILAVVAVLICGFYVYKIIADPGAAILAKYASATGADDSIAFDNFSLSGDAKMVVTRHSTQQIMYEKVTNDNRFPAVEEEFAFTMLFQQPNKTSIEFIKTDASGSYTAFKQVFDGTSGWIFTNIRNQSPRYTDSQDAFAEKKMGMGLEEYDSVEKVEMTDEKIVAEYGLQTMQYMTALSTFYVDEAFRITEKKVILLAKKKHNGKTDATLMFFDEKSGFLIGMIKKGLIDGRTVISKIFTDQYKKFPVKKKGLFGVKNEMIYIPTRWIIQTEPPKTDSPSQNPGVAVAIYLNIQKIDIDTPLKADAFNK